MGSQLKFWIFSEQSHQNNKNFLSPIQSWSANLKKIAVRSSPDPAKTGFSLDPVLSVLIAAGG